MTKKLKTVKLEETVQSELKEMCGATGLGYSDLIRSLMVGKTTITVENDSQMIKRCE